MLSEPSANAYQEDSESEIISKSGISLRVIQNVLCWNIIGSVLHKHNAVFQMTDSKCLPPWKYFFANKFEPASQEMTFSLFNFLFAAPMPVSGT